MKEKLSDSRIMKLMNDQKSDLDLVKAALRNAEDFAPLMEKYERPLFLYIKRLIRVSDAEAEDVLQEVFIKIYQNLNGFDQDLKFSSWAYRISHNHAISYYRKNKKSLDTLSLEDNEALFEKLQSDSNLKERIDEKLGDELMRKLLGKLDQKYRDVLILKYLEDKDYTEISNILKKPMGTIATLLNRAKDKFREILNENNVTL